MTDRNQAAASSDHDSPWKEALERYFPDFLALLFPHIHAEIDWTRGHSFAPRTGAMPTSAGPGSCG